MGGMVVKGVSQRKLDEIRREWQTRLRLKDWRISSKFCDLEFLKGVTGVDEPIGGCEHFAEAKEARIHILRPEDWGGENMSRQQDVENTVVHELLHCHFAAYEAPDEAGRLHQEQAIEAITEALVGLKRRK